MVTKKKNESVKKKIIEKPVIKEMELDIPNIIITKRKINWIGINRKIREYGKMLKIYNLNLPEFKFINKIRNFNYKNIWYKYCNWFNEKFNKEVEYE